MTLNTAWAHRHGTALSGRTRCTRTLVGTEYMYARPGRLSSELSKVRSIQSGCCCALEMAYNLCR